MHLQIRVNFYVMDLKFNIHAYKQDYLIALVSENSYIGLAWCSLQKNTSTPCYGKVRRNLCFGQQYFPGCFWILKKTLRNIKNKKKRVYAIDVSALENLASSSFSQNKLFKNRTILTSWIIPTAEAVPNRWKHYWGDVQLSLIHI